MKAVRRMMHVVRLQFLKNLVDVDVVVWEGNVVAEEELDPIECGTRKKRLERFGSLCAKSRWAICKWKDVQGKRTYSLSTEVKRIG